MTDGVLAAFEGIYVSMGLLGWDPDVVDRMDVWLVARYLGDDDFDPVIRGVRDGLRLPSDRDDSPAPKGGRRGKGRSTYGRFDPRRVIPRNRDPGRVLTGDDAR